MGWMQRLCEVYDAKVQTSNMEGTDSFLPIGFTLKPIKYEIVLTADGEFDSVYEISKEEQICAVPSTPQAESRTGDNGVPFPFADQLKYLVADNNNPRFEAYMSQLISWGKMPDAPVQLQIVIKYLQKKQLLQDLESSSLKIHYYKNDQVENGLGPDAKSIACFSVQNPFEESRLWMRQDIRASWSNYFIQHIQGTKDLCYILGEILPEMQNYPKTVGNAKLISAKDDGFPFQYKGRFVEDKSSTCISMDAGCRAQNALQWLLKKQSFKRYGMYIVVWNVNGAPMKAVPEEEEGFEDEQTGDKEITDLTFEEYARVLKKAARGYNEQMENFSKNANDPAKERMNLVVIMGMQAATDGRMSIFYYQEIPGNEYVHRIEKWYEECCWDMPGKERKIATPTPNAIGRVILGSEQFKITQKDLKGEKSATKMMKQLRIQLLNCMISSQALPYNIVNQAFHRAICPLQFTRNNGAWNELEWAQCVSVTCALIRKYALDHSNFDNKTNDLQQLVIKNALDIQSNNRDYLYGRLLAVACKIEQFALYKTHSEAIPLAIRMMSFYVQRPQEAWLQIHLKLIPYLQRLGTDGHTAGYFQYLLGQIESHFTEEGLNNHSSLGLSFLIGYQLQMSQFLLKKELRSAIKDEPQRISYVPSKNRDELYGCLLAVADCVERKAESQKEKDNWICEKDGCTNAIILMSALEKNPNEAWCRIHNKMIPYLEKTEAKFSNLCQEILRKIEYSFSLQDRQSNKPLGRRFLYGYYSMRTALMVKNGIDWPKWKQSEAILPYQCNCREAVFSALFAIENLVERQILDLQYSNDENRSSNAIRFLAKASEHPADVWEYLAERVKPYLKKQYFSILKKELEMYSEYLVQNGWNTNTPLSGIYLHYFYTYHKEKENE